MLYIVIAAVQAQRNDDWLAWMRDTHIDDVLDTGCFEDATFVRDEDADTDAAVAYRITYRARTAADFERYQAEFGEALRRDHSERFGDDVAARRELLPMIAYRARG